MTWDFFYEHNAPFLVSYIIRRMWEDNAPFYEAEPMDPLTALALERAAQKFAERFPIYAHPRYDRE